MADTDIRQRKKPATATASNGNIGTVEEEHPGGNIKHGGVAQVVRCLLLVTYFLGTSCT